MCYTSNMEPDLLKRFEEQSVKIDAIYKSVEKTRKYFQWTLIITIVVIVLPILVSILILPMLMNSVTSMMGGLTF